MFYTAKYLGPVLSLYVPAHIPRVHAGEKCWYFLMLLIVKSACVSSRAYEYECSYVGVCGRVCVYMCARIFVWARALLFVVRDVHGLFM